MDVGSVWWDFLNRVFLVKRAFFYMFGIAFVEEKCAFIILKVLFVVINWWLHHLMFLPRIPRRSCVTSMAVSLPIYVCYVLKWYVTISMRLISQIMRCFT